MDAFECNGRWWLPGGEDNSVAGTLRVSQGGEMRLSVTGSLGEVKNALAEKGHPIILGSVDKGPKGNEVTLKESFRTGATYGSFKDVREKYHAGRGYFGALLPDDGAFSFKSMMLQLGGLGEWAHSLSGFERQGAGVPTKGQTIPLALYTRKEPLRAQVPGGEAVLGLGFSASFSGRECAFQEEGQVKVTCENPISDDEFNDRYGYALRCLMTFVCDRAQTIERLSVWRPHAPDQEIMVVGELIQPETKKAEDEVSWHEMLFTLNDVKFADFIGRWLQLTTKYQDACNVFFGLMYGPPSFLDMKIQNVANAVRLYYERHPDGLARQAADEQRLKEIVAPLTVPDREWLVDQLGVNPRTPFRVALAALLEKHGHSIEALIGGRQDRFIDTVSATLDYIDRRDRNLEPDSAVGADLYWLTEKLRFLLKACFLHEAGFSADAIRGCFHKNALFQHIYHLEIASSSGEEQRAEEVTEVAPAPPDRHTQTGVRPTGSPTFQAFWRLLEGESPRGRAIGIAAFFDESLGRLLDDRGESFPSKVMTAHRKGLLTNNERDDLMEIRKLRNLVAHQVGGPSLLEDEAAIVRGLKTWRVAAEANPRYEELIPTPEDRLLYVAAVLAARLEKRSGSGGLSPLPEPDFTDLESWPPITSQPHRSK